MATALYLEQYLDSIENLPFELQRNFTLMRDLDQRAQDLSQDIDKETGLYIGNVKTWTPDERVDALKKIEKAFAKSREFNDDKVQLAMQTYEMVDKHIRRLDADLARFEQELKERNIEQITDYDSSSGRDNKKKGRGRTAEKSVKKSLKKGRVSDDETPKQSRKKLKTSTAGQVVAPILTLPTVMNSPSDVLDMPVDPNEPTYCLCHQVSYGEMIGCDNQDCPIEWFHFACVGLTTKPKGKWFCPRCTPDKKKK
ncbi:inhibitor of growth protein 4-like [Asterias rubens]|uniref:inhibitor of growth protein 4-like n=1 Tax=Asterias rubens TaxID=7604 RepID=UPI0014559949|nr:inhibitor of growth protein 4-like [Asterias rubens]